MGQIQDILDLVTSRGSDMESALLRCKVIARRLNYEPLETWVDMELSGYESAELLPDYRKTRSYPTGTFTNGFTQISNRPVDPNVVGDEMFNRMSSLNITSGIGQLTSHGNQAGLVVPLTEFEYFVNFKYSQAMRTDCGFIGLELPIPPGVYESIVSAVKQRLVSFLLDMERIFPEEEGLRNPSAKQKQEMAESFYQTINFYGANNVAVGERAKITDYSHRVKVNIQAGNVDELLRYLKAVGLEDSDISEIEPLLGNIYQGNLSHQQKNKFSDWIREKGTKVGRSLASGTASGLIVEGLIEFAPDAADFLTSIPIS